MPAFMVLACRWRSRPTASKADQSLVYEDSKRSLLNRSYKVVALHRPEEILLKRSVNFFDASRT